jgi:beta-glucosidase
MHHVGTDHMNSPDADSLVAELTLEEKVSLVHGASDPDGLATGYLPGVERLGVPPLCFVDGPMGVRAGTEPATAFPASIALGASWSPDLARRAGAAMAREARVRGQDVLLGPALNVARVPECGRLFEYYSEDPLLTGEAAAAAVEGIQSEGVIAEPKHYVANNQETNRYDVDVEVSERALREIYLPGFRAAVEAGAGSVMAAYNGVNGSSMTRNRRLLTDVLRDEWGFEGFVVSDWFATDTTESAANAGLDVEMPGVPPEEMGETGEALDTEDPDPETAEIFELMPDLGNVGRFGDSLREAAESGSVPEERLDEMVGRVLGQMARFGMLDDVSVDGSDADEANAGDGDADLDAADRGDGAIDTPGHRDLAREIAIEGTVLLDDDGALPLDDGDSIAVLGPHVESAKIGGGGSSEITPFYEVSPLSGLEERAGGRVRSARGAPPIPETRLFGPDAGGDDPDADADELIAEATAVAADADAAVVFVRDDASEFRDRASLSLPGEQDRLVEAVADANGRTVVVARTSGPIEMPWLDDVAAALVTWYPGQEDGNAIAEVLYGDADPGGRLPVTFAPRERYPATDPHQFPGEGGVVEYEEGVFVGYRHFDREGTDPTFPFGHGLSYAEFEYGAVEATLGGGTAAGVEAGASTETAAGAPSATVRATVRNVGDRPGKEVVQTYLAPAFEADVERPERELAGFEAVELDPGEEATVELALRERAFARYDEREGDWVVDPGTYRVLVGRSSRDVRVDVEIRVE